MSKRCVTDAGPLELDRGFEALRSDCARMAPHWLVPGHGAGSPSPKDLSSLIHGVTVPPASARMIATMSEYGG